jgi:hypothetical protein
VPGRNVRERQAAKRQDKLEDIDKRVAEGSLTVRSMTLAERKRFGIADPDRPHRRFFFPGMRPGTRRGDEAYRAAISALREETDGRPTDRKIFRIDCSVEGSPCRLQVGEEITEGGDIVTAIFELRGTDELIVSTADEPAAIRVHASGVDILEFA